MDPVVCRLPSHPAQTFVKDLTHSGHFYAGAGEVRDARAATAVAGAADTGPNPVVLRHDGARSRVLGRHQHHVLHPPPVRASFAARGAGSAFNAAHDVSQPDHLDRTCCKFLCIFLALDCVPLRSVLALALTVAWQPVMSSTNGCTAGVALWSRRGDEYVLDGKKWWTTGACDPRCAVAVFMGKSDPSAATHRQQSMVLVPMDSAGALPRKFYALRPLPELSTCESI